MKLATIFQTNLNDRLWEFGKRLEMSKMLCKKHV